MVWNELTDHLAGRLGRADRPRDRRPADPGGRAAWRALLGVVDRPEEGGAPRRAASRGSAGSRSSSGSSSRRSRSCRSTARCAASCSAPPSRRRSAPSTTSAACAGGRSSPARSTAAAIVGRLRRLGALASRSRSLGVQSLPKPVGVALTMVGIVAVMNMVNFLDGLDGLAAGVCAISALSFAVIDLSRGDVNAAILTGDRLRRLPRLPPPQLLSRPDLHGRLGRAAARLHARRGLGAGPLEDGRPGRARPAAARARRAAARHLLRRREADQARQAVYVGRPHATCITASRTSASRSARPVVYLYAWCATLAIAALATRFVHPHHHGRLGSAQPRDRRRRRPAGDRRLDLRRLPARDREAVERAAPPAKPPAGAEEERKSA